MKVILPIPELMVLREFIEKNIDLEIDHPEILKSALMLLNKAERE